MYKDAETRRERRRALYRGKNKERRRAENRKADRKRYAKLRAFLNEAKNVPCADCGGTYSPWVMDFDHVRGTKKFTIGVLRQKKFAALRREVKKCDVVCANCHRERTHKRR